MPPHTRSHTHARIGTTQAHGPVYVQSSDTLATLMQKAVQADVHRVWVVDEQKSPIGCVRFGDVLYYLRYMFCVCTGWVEEEERG